MENIPENTSRSIVIAVHESVLGNGAAPNLRKFLLQQKNCRLSYISHPLLYVKESYSMRSAYSLYMGSKIVLTKYAYHWKLPEPLLYVKDFLYTCGWVLSTKEKVYLYIGGDNLCALAGLFLKMIGKVRKVVYYGVDYFPTRFSNKMLNSLYHLIDTICVRFCDETWNVSNQMAKAREKDGMRSSAYKRQYTVPMGIWFSEVKRLPINAIDRFRLFFIGTIVDYMGLDLVVRAFPEILKKFPEAELDIVGIGKAKEKLTLLVKELGLTTRVRFHGLLTEGKKRDALFQRSAIGLAPFNTNILDDKVKNADPAKLKEYMSYGMPIIVTDAIAHAEEIKRIRCGIVIPYEKRAFIRAVTNLFSDKKLYAAYRNNALAYVRQFDWNIIFFRNIERIMNV